MPKHYQVQDRFFKKAKDEGFRARSVFKLEGIQDRYQILKSGMKVLDLGAAPGSFMQYVSGIVGSKGLVVGVDLTEIAPLKLANAVTYQGDIYDEGLYKKIVHEKKVRFFDVITSDLAPKTTGIKFVDGSASLELNLQVLAVSQHYLKTGGSLVMKILPGFNEGDLIVEAQKQFATVKKARPEAIRKSSGESYVVCLRKL